MDSDLKNTEPEFKKRKSFEFDQNASNSQYNNNGKRGVVNGPELQNKNR